MQCLLYYSDVAGNGGPTMVVPEGEIVEEAWNRDFTKVQVIRGTESRDSLAARAQKVRSEGWHKLRDPAHECFD